MADTKISALPASTVPLAGTEVLPIVQSGATVKVSIANVTAGRAISATSVTATTGNFVVGTSSQGVTSGAFSLGLGANGSTTAASIDTASNLLVGATSVLGTSAAGSTHITGGANASDQTPLYLRNAFATAGQYWKVGPTNNSGFIIFDPSNNGQYQTYGGTSWISTSDERKKDIIEPITDAVNKVSTLRAIIGKYKTDPENTRRSFLIAQDVQAVLPEAVDANDPENLGVSYTEVIPLLVAAIKELKAEFDAYKASHLV